MISDKKAEKLCDVSLYIQENFNDLKNLINEFPKNILLNKTTYKYEDKAKLAMKDNEEENEEKIDELP